MDSRRMIDAQFDRAVEIVQGLPKTGPIQTGYEEKLTMYSLYKQATVGNVQPPRPSVWDMLGRAKWDAWAKHKDLDPYEAKWLYVEALLKVLRKYSDKTVAMDLVRELESYSGDPSNMVMSGSLSRSRASSSSGSSASETRTSSLRHTSEMPAHLRNDQAYQQAMLPQPESDREETTSDEEEETDDDSKPPLPPATAPPSGSLYAQSQLLNRPQSSLSSQRYRTPMAGSLLMSPPPTSMSVPATQPIPNFETPSAFAGPPSPSIPSSYPTTSVSYADNVSRISRDEMTSPPNIYPAHSGYRNANQPQYPTRQYALQTGITPRPMSRPVLERAVESMQAHLAALTERIETLEGVAYRSSLSLSSRGGSRSPRWSRGSPIGGHGDRYNWDFDDMGMWSLILNPLSRVVKLFGRLMDFIAYNENRSPTLVVIRRLFLDISFILSLLALVKMAWRRSGVRRKEVLVALGMLWRGIIGRQKPRLLVDRGV